MKDLVKRYLDGDISRRRFLSGLTGVGVTSLAAQAFAGALAPYQTQSAAPASVPSWMREMRGTGGELLVAQLKAAGIRHIFCNPSGGSGPFFDALVDQPDIHPIKALEEGAVGAMADGYAKASGKPAFAFIDAAGVPAFLSQMHISSVDHMPVILCTDDEEVRNATDSTTKWRWTAERTDSIPAVTRQALKFAMTPPCGPVLMIVPSAALAGQGQSTIMDQEKFNVSMRMRPDPALVDKAARLLISASNPMLYVGDEITSSGAEKEVVELAELLGLPVTEPGRLFLWSKPFPTRHALFVGTNFPALPFPGVTDVTINIGCRTPVQTGRNTSLIEIRSTPDGVARTAPVEVGIVADVKLAVADLVTAVRSLATAARLKQISEPRIAAVRQHMTAVQDARAAIGKRNYDRDPITMERLALELEAVLEEDTCIVQNIDSGHETMWAFLNFGGENKRFISESAVVLGWGVSAALGVKLAMPDTPVVAIVGDGEFMFRGPQPLWTYARYRAPITVIVTNNHSYNGERNRLWRDGGRMYQTGRDMICYMGDPDIDFTKLAAGVGVDGEVVKRPAEIRPALERAKRANVDGRPYLLDVHVGRTGVAAESTWHPGYSIAAQRTRKV